LHVGDVEFSFQSVVLVDYRVRDCGHSTHIALKLGMGFLVNGLLWMPTAE